MQSDVHPPPSIRTKQAVRTTYTIRMESQETGGPNFLLQTNIIEKFVLQMLVLPETKFSPSELKRWASWIVPRSAAQKHVTYDDEDDDDGGGRARCEEDGLLWWRDEATKAEQGEEGEL